MQTASGGDGRGVGEDSHASSAAASAESAAGGGEDSQPSAAGSAEGDAGGQEDAADDEFGQALYEAEAQQYAQEVHILNNEVSHAPTTAHIAQRIVIAGSMHVRVWMVCRGSWVVSSL